LDAILNDVEKFIDLWINNGLFDELDLTSIDLCLWLIYFYWLMLI